MRRDSRLSVTLHVLLHMAERRGPVTSEFLGGRLRVHPVVIRRTLGGLRDAGLVAAVKGHGGGWSVARRLRDISLLEVYRALDEPLLIRQHRKPVRPPCPVERKVERMLDHTYRRAEQLILSRFRKTRLSEFRSGFLARLKEVGK